MSVGSLLDDLLLRVCMSARVGVMRCTVCEYTRACMCTREDGYGRSLDQSLYPVVGLASRYVTAQGWASPAPTGALLAARPDLCVH